MGPDWWVGAATAYFCAENEEIGAVDDVSDGCVALEHCWYFGLHFEVFSFARFDTLFAGVDDQIVSMGDGVATRGYSFDLLLEDQFESFDTLAPVCVLKGDIEVKALAVV